MDFATIIHLSQEASTLEDFLESVKYHEKADKPNESYIIVYSGNEKLKIKSTTGCYREIMDLVKKDVHHKIKFNVDCLRNRFK